MLGCGIPMVKVLDYGRHVMSSNPVPLKTRRVGQRYTLNLSRAETSSQWCGVVVRRGGASSGIVHVTRPWFKMTWSVAKNPRLAEQCEGLPNTRDSGHVALKLMVSNNRRSFLVSPRRTSDFNLSSSVRYMFD
ncbi:uncharacterized protein TNCV_2616011 [Trichonephila clavipes]|nr:uncharacterized protein TNCV_2616011 [Trichonephila clavipes]